MVIVPNIGAAHLLDLLASYGKFWIHLYVNLAELGPGTVVTDFLEPIYRGYSAQQTSGWVANAGTADCPFAAADPVLFQVTAESRLEQVYGYFVTDGPSGPFCWAESRPAGPIPVEHVGDSVEVMPRLTLRTDPVPC